MKRTRKKSSITLLILFLGISSLPFFAPDAAPLSSYTTQITALAEDETADFNKSIFRTATECQEGNLRTDNFHEVVQVQEVLAANIKVRISQAEDIFNDRKGSMCVYLLNSCLTI